VSDAAPGAQGPAKKILVVEDTPHIRKIICHHLQNEGYGVIEANDGIEALERLKAGGINGVICDIMMPNMDGIAFLKTVREKIPPTSLPVIICSAKGQHDDVLQLIRLGANDYIVKPFTKETLLLKVRKAVGDSGQEPVLPP
jgi:DNA-binding response OmpR family regulator